MIKPLAILFSIGLMLTISAFVINYGPISAPLGGFGMALTISTGICLIVCLAFYATEVED